MDRQTKIGVAVVAVGVLIIATTISLFLWHRARARVALARELDRRLTAEAAPDKVAEKYGLRWPVQPPTHTAEQVAENIARHVRSTASERFAEASNVVEVAKRAEELFRTRSIGERVSFRIWRSGTGEERVEGILRGYSDDRVQVNSRWLDRRDIIEQHRHIVFSDESKARIEQYVQATLAAVGRQRAGFMRQLAAQVAPEFYEQAGYVRRPPEGGWITQQQCLDILVDSTRQHIEKEVYTAHGYIQRDGHWVRETIWAKIIRKIGDLLGASSEQQSRLAQTGTPFGKE